MELFVIGQGFDKIKVGTQVNKISAAQYYNGIGFKYVVCNLWEYLSFVKKFKDRRVIMKTVWLVNPYGPIEGEKWRAYSFNQFGKYLSRNGFNVIWWTANFAHHFKNYRSNGWKDIEVNKNFIIRLVPTSSYKKNFSMGRFIKDVHFAKNAYKGFKNFETPDIIISADNPLTLNYPSFKYAKEKNIPIIYDQMDLWPEFMENVASQFLKPFLKIMFKPVYKQREKNYKQLSGIIALGKNYLEKAKEIEITLNEKPQALIYNGIDVENFRVQLSRKIEVPNLPKIKNENEVWCVFAGTLGPSYDILTIIECAKRFKEEKNSKIRFIIAGSGPYEAEVIKASKELPNFNFVGKLLPKELIPIYGMCDIGLATYTSNSNVDMPDKFYDYTAAGLAVINSLKGEIYEFVEKYKVGVNYKASDIHSMYKSIEILLDNEKLSLFKKNSLELAMEFDEKVQNDKLLNIIRQILSM
ncbi:Glycosyltransferase involved in cell wall bisynthesis [Proteiniborus ethanoligenes]|uniref:Glycosyltransferase involved in cell wall bisynthesis n=1 Tax=Proteiniborus ethanoligenes TaxID=415015 RepID=A0A1H3LQ73_9FIRM|nr:glycosyltransferase family 4 protein [Proteiniborus ethanoligenes]SDY66582.1 Glycosyltransferase involved in cell wall bisynthesis [Proteiniborus ethanoligenes]